MSTLPRGTSVRRDAGLYGYERTLRRHGLSAVAGWTRPAAACARPLVAGAAILPDGRSGIVPGLADSKLLTPRARERCYAEIVRRAVSWSVVVLPTPTATGWDARGEPGGAAPGRRPPRRPAGVRAHRRLPRGRPGRPGLAVWKGDRVAGCVAAASVLAKVHPGPDMTELHERWPVYDFATHKGYVTQTHAAALLETGPRRCTGAGSSTYAGPRPEAGSPHRRVTCRGRPKTVRTPVEKRAESGAEPLSSGSPSAVEQAVLDQGRLGPAQRPRGVCVRHPQGPAQPRGVQPEPGGEEDLQRTGVGHRRHRRPRSGPPGGRLRCVAVPAAGCGGQGGTRLGAARRVAVPVDMSAHW